MTKKIFSPMRGWLCLALLLAAPMLAAAGTQTGDGPVAVVPETVYEFPDTVDGEYVVHDFVVRNQGDDVLNVLKVKTT